MAMIGRLSRVLPSTYLGTKPLANNRWLVGYCVSAVCYSPTYRYSRVGSEQWRGEADRWCTDYRETCTQYL